MNSKGEVDGGVVTAIVSIALMIGFIIFMINFPGGPSTSTDTTKTYQEYDQWKAEQRQNEADEVERQRELEGYACTSDCSGHQAGYEWAEVNNVCSSSYSGGNSQSFNEGVRARAANRC